MVVISHFKLYPALFPLKWLICIPNILALRGNVVFEKPLEFYRTAIIKRKCAFSQVVTMIRLTLMYDINFISFMENPDKTWEDMLEREVQKAPPEPILFS